MENKNVGILILGISVLIIFIILLFNNAMKEIVMGGCPAVHQGLSCPAYRTINQQTYLALAIVGILFIIGFVLIFSKPKEKIVIRKIKETEEKRKINVSDFTSDERTVLKIIQQEGTIFQADLIEKTGFGKAKITRILDRLEGRSVIDRKRRGMTNVVVLKE
ncbi:MAG: MarR family transcriptional regulator [Nanoarchaeota archaeon]